ncbi:ectonucleoside triphosphate diphosphohydrolase 5-like isoform X1 [Lytechinus variegatus]|uniref:ectonucleoside triphosphate diphosphohydrolase 5-like isoform X1 n=1 Tax=Lytechinus variegatus TaxID=7654 RepID=UPI001BB1632D|nr:ectonucleoside triphosphate diphosphohydrolase 5-like isoform X1 [Lytechinus variegatus]XP_041469601.1 ectonucleoside triphosphate diphosphohydrolase 5-like isoform X1 [Lytechinus variegatus]XP_041469602.1 ectonucleoside triphosphate diphosphohydrolase 5-like isoform X1 [Lytechinus variegatus]
MVLDMMQRMSCKIMVVSITILSISLLYLTRKQTSSSDLVVPQESIYDFMSNKDTPWRSDDDDLSEIQQKDDYYGVMFDAGSTGSRVHVFHFQETPKGIPPILLSEVFNFTNLPLAQYADNPAEGAASIKVLLDVALRSIPFSHWSTTPVALKATAGLRLIPERKAKALLNEVYAMFKRSSFHVETPETTVDIMNGTDEGIFMWVTVNFLNRALISSTPETRGTLDMGGGSTQVTFLPRNEETLSHQIHNTNIKTYPFLHHQYKLYTKSFLGLGLKAARLEILKREKENPIFVGSSDTDQLSAGSEEFTSACLPPFTSGTWDFGGNMYSVSSSNIHSENIYENCLSVVKAFIEDTVIVPTEMQESSSFYALSYFWERAAEIEKVDWKEGGTMLVKDYREAAINVCLNHSLYADKPFHCMDLVYLSSVLSHGYKFRDDVQLLMTNAIDGFRVSWALGATLELLRKHWEHLKKL